MSCTNPDCFTYGGNQEPDTERDPFPSNPHLGHYPGALKDTLHAMADALEPLAKIADRYDSSDLDEERPEWKNEAAEKVELYFGRGGAALLTLADCFRARAVLRRFRGSAG